MRLTFVLMALLAACEGRPIGPGAFDASPGDAAPALDASPSDLEFPPCSASNWCPAGVCCFGSEAACVPPEDCVAPNIVLCRTQADCQAALGGGACCDDGPARHCCEL